MAVAGIKVEIRLPLGRKPVVMVSHYGGDGSMYLQTVAELGERKIEEVVQSSLDEAANVAEIRLNQARAHQLAQAAAQVAQYSQKDGQE